METKPPQEFIDTEQPPDYYQKMSALFDQRTIQISEETLTIAANQLNDLRHKYHDHAYHNDIHSYDDLQRALNILDSIARYIPISPKEYELLTTACVYHDDIITATPHSNLTPEEESAYQAMKATNADSSDSLRLANLVKVTEVTYDQNGVHQIHFIDDNKDILKFALGFADVGATLMEGGDRLVQDVVNLALEQYITKHNRAGNIVDTLTTFIQMQRRFIEERMHNLTEGIHHYFGAYGEHVVQQISTNLLDTVTESLLELQPLLAKFDAQLPFIRYQLQTNLNADELKARGDCSISIQQKLKEILDKI